jgi:ABC-type multidrug transport system permease subunit
MKKSTIAAWFVTIYLVVYSSFCFYDVYPDAQFIMFALSPILVIIMAVMVLKEKNIKVVEFNEEQEWGYEDK